MKKSFLFIITAILTFSCKSKPTNQQRAEPIVNSIILKTIDDPHSYQSVAFSKLDKPNGAMYPIRHTYRAKNKFGALVLIDDCFMIDTAFQFGSCCVRNCPLIKSNF